MEKHANLQSSSFQLTIDGMLERGTSPPDLSSTEINRSLRSVNIGSFAVKEVLTSKSHGLPVRFLCRIATRVVLERMDAMPEFDELKAKWKAYELAVRDLAEDERVMYADDLEATKKAYRCFVPRKYAIWFWDSDNRDAIEAKLENAGLPLGIVYAFIAEVLSEMSSVSDEQRKSLKRDHRRGVYHIRLLLATLDLVLDTIGENGVEEVD